MRRVIACGVVACFPCFGCSFAFVAGPPSEPSEPHVASSQCTTSVLYPVLDSVAAGIGALNIGIAANASPGEVSWYGIEMESETGVALGITQLAVFGAGAVYGFIQTSRCQAFLEQRPVTPEGPTWSPARAPEAGSPPEEGGSAQTLPAAPPAASAAAPTQPAAPPLPPPSPATSAAPPAGTAPPPASSSPKVPTASFPD